MAGIESLLATGSGVAAATGAGLPVAAILGGASAALSLGKSIFGAIQTSKAKNSLNGMNRPRMQIPVEAEQALLNAQKNALLTTLPGQDILQQGIDRNTMSNVNALGEI